jgi:hypothetical protein
MRGKGEEKVIRNTKHEERTRVIQTFLKIRHPTHRHVTPAREGKGRQRWRGARRRRAI